MTLPFIIVGAGGHAAVVADALLAAGARVLGFVDANPACHGRTLCGLQVLGDDNVLERHAPTEVVLANGIGGIGCDGDHPLRRRVQHRLGARGWRFIGVRHPGAAVSPFAHVADDAQLLACSAVQPHARVGQGCIVNTGAIVEHDVVLGEWTHLAPGAVVCGDVVIGPYSHIGAGAVVRQGLRLGNRTMVGAGAVVVSDFAGGGVLVGVPARSVERHA